MGRTFQGKAEHVGLCFGKRLRFLRGEKKVFQVGSGRGGTARAESTKVKIVGEIS